MDDDFLRNVLRNLEENISSITSPIEGVSDIVLFPNVPTDQFPPAQMQLSQKNGVCVPQRRYEKGAGRNLLTNQNLVLFTREDGSYIPVAAALKGEYTGLVCRDLPVLSEAGFTITLRFEVNGSHCPWRDAGTHRLHSGQGIRPMISR